MRRGINHTNLFNFLKRVSAFIFNLRFIISGLPQTPSGLLFTTSGLPKKPSGLLFTTSGLPDNASGLLFIASGLPDKTSGLPFIASGLPDKPSGKPEAVLYPLFVSNKPYQFTVHQPFFISHQPWFIIHQPFFCLRRFFRLLFHPAHLSGSEEPTVEVQRKFPKRPPDRTGRENLRRHYIITPACR